MKFQNPIWLRILRGLWPYEFWSNILILRGKNLLKSYVWNSCMVTNQDLRPNHASDKNIVENRPAFFPKKWGSFSFKFLVHGKVWPKITIHHHSTISHVIFHDLDLLKSKNLEKSYGHNPLKILYHVGFLKKLKKHFRGKILCQGHILT